MSDGVVRCVDCGHVNAAEQWDVKGELEPLGVEECPDCGGTEFVPITAEMTEPDTSEPPDAET